MIFTPIHCYIGQTNPIFRYLVKYLNEILKSTPPLQDTLVFTKELSDALMRFRIFYNSKNPKKRLAMRIGLENEVWGAIGEMLGETRLRQEILTLKDPALIKMLQGLPPLTIPPYSADIAACDKRLAEIFGGIVAVVAGSGYEPPDKDGNRAYRGGKDGHLSDRAMHLYGDNEGTKVTEVFIPTGFQTPIYPNPRTLEEYKGGSFVAYYPILGTVKNVSLIITHLAKFTPNSTRKNPAGSVYVGEIGGRGGEKNPKGKYMHAHFEIVEGKVVPNKSTSAAKHYSFMEVFCK